MLVKPSASAQTASEKTSVPVKSTLTKGLKNNYGLRVLIVISLALHGALLLLPMPQGWLTSAPEPEDLDVVEESGAIALTTLPVVTKPLPKEADVPIAPPVVEVPPTVPVPPPQAPLTQLPDELPEPLESLEELELLDDELEPETPPEEEELEQTEPSLETSEPEAGIAVQFSSDFPHITGSESGCYGLENCRRAEGENYTDALKNLSQQLEKQGYELTPYDNDDSDVRNHRIYEMHRPNDPDAGVNYLNVFGDGLKAAIYMITPHLITQADLQALENGNQTDE